MSDAIATSISLLNKRVAILATGGFEQSELEEPMKALEEAGAIGSVSRVELLA